MAKSNKGGAFERDMCKLLSRWWTHGERDDIFWRTAGSGARAKVRSRRGVGTHGSYGDISAVDPSGEPFIQAVTPELKRGYKLWSVQDMLDAAPRSAKQTFQKFWEQVCEDCESAETEPMVIFKKDRRVACCAITEIFFAELEAEYGTYPYIHMALKNFPPDKAQIVVLRLENFLDWCQPEFFKEG